MGSKPRDTWLSLGSSRVPKRIDECFSIAQFDFSTWEEADANRYNDNLNQVFGKCIRSDLAEQTHGAAIEKRPREPILMSAVLAGEGRQKGLGFDGRETQHALFSSPENDQEQVAQRLRRR